MEAGGRRDLRPRHEQAGRGECQEGVFSDQYREMHNDTYYHRECYARRVANLGVAKVPSAITKPQTTPDAHARSEELRQSPRAAAPVSEEPVESSGGEPNAHTTLPGRSETAGRQDIQLDQGESAVLHAQVKLLKIGQTPRVRSSVHGHEEVRIHVVQTARDRVVGVTCGVAEPEPGLPT